MELEWLQKIGEQNSEGKRELLSRYKPYRTRTFEIVLPSSISFLKQNNLNVSAGIWKVWVWTNFEACRLPFQLILAHLTHSKIFFCDMTHSIMCPSLEPLPTSVTGWTLSAQNAPNHVMWCMMPGLCYSYSGLSLIPTSADRTCSNLSYGKHTRHFLESLGTRRGWGDGWSSPDSTPSLSASAREVLDSHWRWQRPRRDVHPLPPTTRVPSGQTWHPSHPIRDTAVRCPAPSGNRVHAAGAVIPDETQGLALGL